MGKNKIEYYKYGKKYLAVGQKWHTKVNLYDFHISIEKVTNKHLVVGFKDISISKIAFTRALNKAKRILTESKII